VTDSVLAAIEHDASAASASAFARTAAGFLRESAAGKGQVSTSLSPADLAARFAEPLPRHGAPLDDVLARIERDVLSDAIRLSHPMYLGHQVSAPLPAAVWADSIASAVNNSLAVSEMSPTGTALETRVVRWMADLAGFGAGAGGTFTSGGTEATFTALLAARAAALPGAWDDGVGDRPPVLVCGEHAHYAVARAAGELGLGMRRVVTVPSRDHRMDAGALDGVLDRLYKEEIAVMAVVATAGSTATGSFDDLDAIGRSCEGRGLWLHVDAAHGASALLSSAHRSRLRGIERATSIAWDPHKMMLVPVSAGVLLVRDERALERAFAQRAPYLFHGGDGERIPDQGVRSFQCSRRLDALKVWVALQRYGADGIGALYDRLCEAALALHVEIGRRPEFEAMHEPESNILCFRWIGDGALNDAALDGRNRDLRERYNSSGKGWITTTVLDGRRVLRVTIMNPRSTAAHTTALLDGLVEQARAI